jgi:diadenosine tetraphosphatase ApaH/serine/threonine PP2A family protein phosphatase
VAVISDIHGNLHALASVLRSIDAESPDELWCLGDLVGYGPRPNRCCTLVAERADVCLIGNHDLGVLGRIDLEDFAPDAAISARWTAEVLEDEPRRYLESLSPSAILDRSELYHASPRDPVWEYVLSTWQAEECIDIMDARVAAVGHSHVALWFRRDGAGKTSGDTAPASTELDLSDGSWLVNPGGVGQPRDGDPRAAWLLLDTSTWTATWRRVEYPIDEAARAIEEAGLPRVLAERLYSGQ